METPVTDPIVTDYLHRLSAAAAGLPEDRRTDLVNEITEHIEQARAAGAVYDEASVRTLLDRLGDPQEIAAAAREDRPNQFGPDQVGSAFVLRRPSIAVEGWAVALMTVGSIVPMLGWLVGAVLMWTSSRWRVREKVLATLVVPTGPFGALWATVLFSGGGQSCTTVTAANGDFSQSCTAGASGLHQAVGIPLVLIWAVAPIVVCGWLYTIARRRADAEPSVAVRIEAQVNRRGASEIVTVALLTVGAVVLFIVGPVVGLILAWRSTVWTRQHKWIATAIVAIPAALYTVSFTLTELHNYGYLADDSSLQFPLFSYVFPLFVLCPIGAGIFLWTRLNRPPQ